MSRRRLSGEEARARILDAAGEQLRISGPSGLRLDPIAEELGVSRQALLHHFGTRDGLIAAVVQRALDALQGELAAALADVSLEDDPGRVIGRAFDVVVDGGYGRLLGWLALEHGDHSKLLLGEGQHPLAILAQLTHAAREREAGPADPRDTTLTVLLACFAILGAAVFEPGVLRAAGLQDDDRARADFRDWLAKLLVAHLERREGGTE
ncbi:MAG: TetR/AcrR family transcriptional regulator [Myxococcota bacterium]|nr:TetR/AcrR family transcriptional regulator [Myxococcota bacterium]